MFTSRAVALLMTLVAVPFALAQDSPPAGAPGPAEPAPEAFGASHPPDTLPDKPPVPPLSVELNAAPDSVPLIELGPVDMELLAREDEERRASGSKVLRYGVGRDVLLSLGDGVWADVGENGHLWSLDVRAEGAIGLRLHFTGVDLLEGGQIAVYSASEQPPRVWTFAGRGWFDNGEFWVPTVFGDTVRIEYYHPKHVDDPDALDLFQIDRVQHIYLDPLAGTRGAAQCLDVTCLGATWADTARASAGIGFTGTDALYCSGTMLNATNSDLTPYWLTANHCLSTNGDAQGSEIYWLFQTSACNGTPPSITTVPQSAPCTLLATGTTSDFTLLMVDGTVPRTSIRWAGWASAAVANGTACTSIHHPRGSWKRYSQGTKQSVLNCSASGHVNIDWTTRGTEPGSSGSGVFRNDNQQLFGQLHCGPSNCETANSEDDYGAFVTSFPNISTLLAGGSDDALEQNDTCASPRVMGEGTSNNLIVKSVDEDWYRVTVPPQQQITVTLNFTHAWGDVDTDLEGPCGTVLDASHGVGNSETLQWTNTSGGSADVQIQVYLFSDTRNGYSMTIGIDCPPSSIPANDACANAQNLVIGGAFGGNISCATNDGSSSCGSSSTNRDVWWSFTPVCNGMLTVNTCGTHDSQGLDTGMDTVISIHTGCPGTTANQVAGGCNDDAAGDACGAADDGIIRDSYLTVAVVAGQNYRIRVTHFSSAIDDGEYDLTSSFSADPLPGPTGVAASDGTSCAGVIVSWNAVVGATNYLILRNTVNNVLTATQVGSDTASPFSDTTAAPGLTYFYWVRATGPCGAGGFGGPDSGSRGDVPAAPTGVAASDSTSCTEITVAWNAVAGATGYEIWRNNVNNSATATQVGTDTASPFSDTTAPAGPTFFYWVRATNTCGPSAFSASDSGRRNTPPDNPTGVNATDDTFCDRVQVSWTHIAGATGYEIWRNTVNNSATATLIGTDTASPFDDFTAVAGTQYFYWVRSTNACGPSPFSVSNAGRRCVANPCPADLNSSGDIDLGDLAILLANFGSVGAGIPGDLDGNGAVELNDLAALLALFGSACP